MIEKNYPGYIGQVAEPASYRPYKFIEVFVTRRRDDTLSARVFMRCGTDAVRFGDDLCNANTMQKTTMEGLVWNAIGKYTHEVRFRCHPSVKAGHWIDDEFRFKDENGTQSGQ